MTLDLSQRRVPFWVAGMARNEIPLKTATITPPTARRGRRKRSPHCRRALMPGFLFAIDRRLI